MTNAPRRTTSVVATLRQLGEERREKGARFLRAYEGETLRYLRLVPDSPLETYDRPTATHRGNAPSEEEIESARRFLMKARAEHTRRTPGDSAGQEVS